MKEKEKVTRDRSYKGSFFPREIWKKVDEPICRNYTKWTNEVHCSLNGTILHRRLLSEWRFQTIPHARLCSSIEGNMCSWCTKSKCPFPTLTKYPMFIDLQWQNKNVRMKNYRVYRNGEPSFCIRKQLCSHIEVKSSVIHDHINQKKKKITAL